MIRPQTIAVVLTIGLATRAASGQTPDEWYESGARAVTMARQREPITGPAKNVILFIGDGMGISTVTAARVLDGQRHGKTGEENSLSFESFPHTALIKTYTTNQQVPDSAGTMSAIVTGVKTKAGVLSVDGTVTRGSCRSADGHARRTILEIAEASGRSTGIVTTTRVTHATPAACYAHSPERDWERDSAMPSQERAAGCLDIARQLVEFHVGNGLDVVFGGGRQAFLPASAADPEYPDLTGRRGDGRNLIAEWLAKPGTAYVWNKRQFDTLNASAPKRVLGLFEPSHMKFEHDRARDAAGEPSLAQMTATAIELLSTNEKGFFLMVEAGRIDHAHHDTNAFRALTDTIALSEAVRVARAATDRKDTLIIVTADHSHVFTIAGYPTRGNPILGKVIANDASGRPMRKPVPDARGKPYTTLGYANGPARYGAASTTDLSTIDTEGPDYRQKAAVFMQESETHGGEDVPLYADGPGAYLFGGAVEQHVIFHVMAAALSGGR